VRWNVDNNYSIIVTIIRDSEGNMTCMIAQHKKNRIVVRWFDTVLKMLRPQHNRSSITRPFSGARISSSDRTTFSKLWRHRPFGMDQHSAAN
jgi:hypothetical protein